MNNNLRLFCHFSYKYKCAETKIHKYFHVLDNDPCTYLYFILKFSILNFLSTLCIHPVLRLSNLGSSSFHIQTISAVTSAQILCHDSYPRGSDLVFLKYNFRSFSLMLAFWKWELKRVDAGEDCADLHCRDG